MANETAGPAVPGAFVVRIFGPDGEIAGVGTLVGERGIITCAHVVNAALGRAELAQELPDGFLTLDFPLVAADGGPFTATVAAWVPPPRPGAAGDDVAGLLLTSEPPPGAWPARLGVEPARAGQELLVFGYPGDPPRSNGVFVPTTVRGRVGGGKLKLDTDPKAAHRIQPGFSGSPVFDASIDRVVGMLALAPSGDAQPDSDALGADQLRQAWPDALAARWQRAGAVIGSSGSGLSGSGLSGSGNTRTELTILHVSDTRFGKKRTADHADSLFGLLHDDLAGLARDSGLRPDLLVFTGDLAAEGLRSDFAQGLRFLTALSEAAEIPRRHIAIVPGNHDVNQRACAAYFAEQDSREEPVVEPYFPKWRDYAAACTDFYASVPGVTFTPDEPWTLFEMPELNVVVAGLNSTIAESHLDDGHYGSVAGQQLQSFARRLTLYRRLGYLRLAAVHHNVVRDAALGTENLRDAVALDRILGESRLANLLLQGHAHDSRQHSLASGLPVLSAGSTAVEAGARAAEVPSQYQLITVRADGFTRHARRYEPRQRRWIGDTRITANGAGWQDHRRHELNRVDAAFPPVPRGNDRRQAQHPRAADGPAGSVQDQRLYGIQLGSRNVQINNFSPSPPQPEESFLGRVAEATETRYPTARITRRSGTDCDYLRISLAPDDGGTAEQWPVGVVDGPATEAALGSFVTQVHAQFRADDPQVRSELVYRGPAASAQLVALARRRGVRLRSFVDYQGLLDLGPLAERQRERLAADPVYPRQLYVEQRFQQLSLAGHTAGAGAGVGAGLIRRAVEWLSAADARLIVVLGDFGRGKTSFLRQLTRRLPDELPGVLPVLVELRTLEKAPTLDELLGQHLIKNGVEDVNPAKLRYMIRSGRVALLFDGFDGFELRVGYDNAADYLQTLLDSVADRAKVILTSRTQHFRSSDQVKTALGARVETRAGSRVVVLEDFTEEQIRQFLANLYEGDTARAEARLSQLRAIENLLDLAHNPRMLAFVAELDDEQLDEVRRRAGRITQAGLYGKIIDFWLTKETERQQHQRGLRSFDKDERLRACTALALKLWSSTSLTIAESELAAEVAATLTGLAERGYTEAQASHSIASGSLLVRTDDHGFAFIHQSVMEWLVAFAAARDPKGADTLALRQISRLMADFYIDLAGTDPAVAWVSTVLSSRAPRTAKQNALTVAKRLGLAGLLTGQNLSRADLRGLDLTDADLHGADLSRANLAGMRLSGTNLSAAALGGAKLMETRLTGGSLRGAVLVGSRWTRAAILGTEGIDELMDTPELEAAAIAGRDRADVMIRPPLRPSCVAYSPDGALLAIGSSADAEIIDTRDGRILRLLRGHTTAVNGVAFSPDGTLIATASGDGTARTWDTATGTHRTTLTGHTDIVWGIAFSPDGTLIATASGDGTARTWDTATGTHRTTLTGHTDIVWGIAFSPDGTLIATASWDNTARTWDTITGSPRATLTGHTDNVNDVAFSPDGTLIATASDDRTARTWDTATGTPRATLTGHTDNVRAVAFSPDGTLIATASDDRTARTWDTATGTHRTTLTGHTDNVRAVAFSPDGTLIATASWNDNTARTWDTATGTPRATLTGPNNWMRGVAFSPDGTLIATASDDRTARTWDTATGTPRATLTGHTDNVNDVAFSPDGTLIATASDDRTARTWDTATGTPRATLTGHTDNVNDVAFSPDGTLIATASGDNTARTWDTATGTPRTTLTGHTDNVNDVAFSPDGTLIATASGDNTARTWDTATGTPRTTLTGHTDAVWGVAFSPDGTLIATTSWDGTARTWDTATGTPRTTLTGHTDIVWGIAFSPDGTLIATASGDGTARTWDTATGTPRTTLTGHGSTVWGAAFSPDGTLIATTSWDGTTRTWDANTGNHLVTLVSLPDGGHATLLPDGRYKLEGDPGDTLWWAIKLCRFAPGELDPYVPEIRRLRREDPVPAVVRVAPWRCGAGSGA